MAFPGKSYRFRCGRKWRIPATNKAFQKKSRSIWRVFQGRSSFGGKVKALVIIYIIFVFSLILQLTIYVFCRLLHDLHTTKKFLPPETRVRIELTKTADDVFLQNGGTDQEICTVDLYELVLFVPVITLDMQVAIKLKER